MHTAVLGQLKGQAGAAIGSGVDATDVLWAVDAMLSTLALTGNLAGLAVAVKLADCITHVKRASWRCTYLQRTSVWMNCLSELVSGYNDDDVSRPVICAHHFLRSNQSCFYGKQTQQAGVRSAAWRLGGRSVLTVP